ncbi:MAG TPA: hypothetical protein VLB44_11670 [Kofleriaceae bacterium]|nr:hypothetical protein [Kofleriaceae bacterium]
MKRIALLLVLASSVTACASLTKGGARGPQIQRTDDSAQSQQPENGSLDGRPELGQR